MKNSSEALRPGFQQFRHEGCYSYLIFDRTARAAVIVDPCLDVMDHYREFIGEKGLRILFAVDTHLQADHFSASHLFKEEYGAEILQSAHAAGDRATRRLQDGEEIAVGAMKFRALLTPGHAQESLCLLGEGMLLSGDALLIGASGRCDHPGSDASALWKSLHRLMELAGETLVFPAHDYQDLLFSTIARERTHNSIHRYHAEADFVAAKGAESLPCFREAATERLRFNAMASPAMPANPGGHPGPEGAAAHAGDGRMSSINVEKYHNKVEEGGSGFLFIDVREDAEFSASRIPGTTNVPLSELGFHLPRLTAAKRIYFSCLSGRRSHSAAKTLTYLGFPDAVNVTGGFKAWTHAGLPVAR